MRRGRILTIGDDPDITEPMRTTAGRRAAGHRAGFQAGSSGVQPGEPVGGTPDQPVKPDTPPEKADHPLDRS